jgi:hypothetical protein
MSTWKTPKGTELYLIDLKGKPYLPVAERLIWFGEEHPDWQIKTKLQTKEGACLATAWIRDNSGFVRAMAHKHEDKQGFADYIEKSETGAIGRALALCGYGTQFCADELDEKDRLADAPRNVPAKDVVTAIKTNSPPPAATKETPTNDDDYIVQFGFLKGKKIGDCPNVALRGALDWLKTKAPAATKKFNAEFMRIAEERLIGPLEDDLDLALHRQKDKDKEPPEWVTEEIPF